MNTYLDSRIIILNSAHGRLLNGTYKSNIEFSFNGLLKQEDNRFKFHELIHKFLYHFIL